MPMWSTMLGEVAPAVSVSSAVTGPSFTEALVRMVVTLVTVVVLLALAARFGPRLFGRLRSGLAGAVQEKGPAAIRVVSSVQLSPSQRLILVAVEGRRLLLSVGAGTTSLICELDEDGVGGGLEDAVGSDAGAAGRQFSELMRTKSRPVPSAEEKRALG